MGEMPVAELRERFGEVVSTAGTEPVFLTQRGRRVAVIISMSEYQALVAAREDAEDLVAADAAMAEIVAGAPVIPWEQVKSGLGLA